MIHVLRHAGLREVLAVGRELIERSEATVFRRRVVDTIYSAYAQVLDRLYLGIHVSREASHLVTVVGVGHHCAVGVAFVGIPVRVGCVVEGRAELAVVAVDRSKRGHVKRTAE